MICFTSKKHCLFCLWKKTYVLEIAESIALNSSQLSNKQQKYKFLVLNVQKFRIKKLLYSLSSLEFVNLSINRMIMLALNHWILDLFTHLFTNSLHSIYLKIYGVLNIKRICNFLIIFLAKIDSGYAFTYASNLLKALKIIKLNIYFNWL